MGDMNSPFAGSVVAAGHQHCPLKALQLCLSMIRMACRLPMGDRCPQTAENIYCCRAEAETRMAEGNQNIAGLSRHDGSQFKSRHDGSQFKSSFNKSAGDGTAGRGTHSLRNANLFTHAQQIESWSYPSRPARGARVEPSFPGSIHPITIGDATARGQLSAGMNPGMTRKKNSSFLSILVGFTIQAIKRLKSTLQESRSRMHHYTMVNIEFHDDVECCSHHALPRRWSPQPPTRRLSVCLVHPAHRRTLHKYAYSLVLVMLRSRPCTQFVFY